MSSRDLDFDVLRELHDSVNNLLHSPDTKLEIFHHGHEKLAQQISEAALKMADSCASAKDLLLLTKDHLHSLQSAFRRGTTTDKPNVGINITTCRLPRKQLKKAILKRLDSLKNTCIVGSTISTPPPDQVSLVVVVNMLKEVRATTLSIVRSLMSLIAMPNPKSKQGPAHKDPPMFRLRRLTRVDSLSFWEKCAVSDARTVTKRLEEVELAVDDMEAELERMFRRLIRTRASLLNILST